MNTKLLKNVLIFFSTLLLFFNSFSLISQTETSKLLNIDSDFFKNFGFGLGVGLDYTSMNHIEDFNMVGNTPYITKESNFKPSLYFTTVWNFDKNIFNQSKSYGHIRPGLYTSLKVNGDNVFSGFGVGGLLAFKRDLDGKESLNFGFGYSRTQIATFVDGITGGEPMPENFDRVLTKETWVNGFQLIVSFKVF